MKTKSCKFPERTQWNGSWNERSGYSIGPYLTYNEAVFWGLIYNFIKIASLIQFLNGLFRSFLYVSYGVLIRSGSAFVHGK